MRPEPESLVDQGLILLDNALCDDCDLAAEDVEGIASWKAGATVTVTVTITVTVTVTVVTVTVVTVTVTVTVTVCVMM